MRASLLLLPLLLLLSACQTPRLERDFDPSRDFAAYRSWSWQEPAVQFKPNDPRINSDLTSQRIRAAVSEQLEQRGLRAATAPACHDRLRRARCLPPRAERWLRKVGGTRRRIRNGP